MPPRLHKNSVGKIVHVHLFTVSHPVTLLDGHVLTVQLSESVLVEWIIKAILGTGLAENRFGMAV